jgi:hypothetical protein
MIKMADMNFPDIGGCETLIQFGDPSQISSSKPFSMVNFANDNLQCRFRKLTDNNPEQLIFIPGATVDLVVSPVADFLANPLRIAKDIGVRIPRS